MNWIQLLLIAISVIGLLSTLVCGLWIEYSGQPKEKSNLLFHMILALFSIIVTIFTFVTMV